MLGPEHPATVTVLNNMAVLLQDQGAHLEARSYLEQALAIDRKVLGEEHPDTALTLNNLALLLHMSSRHSFLKSQPTIRSTSLRSTS